jgi:hypothetical protein
VLFGVLCAILVPAHPDVIMAYVSEHHIEGNGATAVFATWGAACGQFADYLFAKAKGAMEVFARSGGSGGGSSSPPKAPKVEPEEEEKDEGENVG